MKPFTIVYIAWVTLTGIEQKVDPNKLVGRWQRNFSDGRTALAIFRTNGSVAFFLDNKFFGSGRYYLQQDTFGLSYSSCNEAHYGTYRIRFCEQDSVQFNVLQGTCQERKTGMDGVSLARIKTDKT